MVKTRRILFGVALALSAIACTKTYTVRPASGAANATANSAGLTLTATPNAWNQEPSDLDEYLTPIWIKLENHQSKDIRVVYADIVLSDESGFRYAAISPYSGQPGVAAPQSSAPPSQPQNPAPQSIPVPSAHPDHEGKPAESAPPQAPSSFNRPSKSGDEPTQIELTRSEPTRPVSPNDAPISGASPSSELSRHGQTGVDTEPDQASSALRFDNPDDLVIDAALVRHIGGGFRGGGGHIGVGAHGGYYGGHSHLGYGYWGHGYWGHGHWWGPYSGVGIYGYPYYYGYPFYVAWPYFYYWPAYYGPYAYYWDDRYYPGAPSEDILRYGMPQGALKAGGKVAGFVYFQNAATRATRLDLTWNAHTVDGKSVGVVRVPLVVVRE